MELVTHFLTGACLGRAGFNRKTLYATLAMTLAAEAPDIDVLWSFRGPVVGFEHHRGFTHTLIGAPFMALLVTGAVWLWHRWRNRHDSEHVERKGIRKKLPPVRWGLIWFFALIADFSHLLLDWTNNYGLRPFLPFNPRWYAANIFFIFEPLMFAALLLALVFPAILGLADREIGARRTYFRGRGWAIFALCFAVLLGCWRWAEHDRALHLLAQQNYRGAAPLKITVSPYPVDVFKWFGVVETKNFYQTAIINTRTDAVATQVPEDIYYKQPQTAAVLAAERSWLGRVFLDWSKFPLVEQVGALGPYDAGQYTRVKFRDLRFAYHALFLEGRKDNVLGGSVTVGPTGQIEEMEMDGRVQK